MNKGVTLIELLIAISILIILTAAAVPIYGNLQVSSQINENTTLIVQTVRTARQNSVSRVNGQSHGVKFLSDRFVMYQGSSYDTREAPYDRIIPLDSALSLSTDFLNDEINFSKSLGVPSEEGTITLTHDVGGVRNVLVNKIGLVEED